MTRPLALLAIVAAIVTSSILGTGRAYASPLTVTSSAEVVAWSL
jgi:hypothetical protein